jgi:F0F1-type ATP synthase epsilon subunit
LPGKITVLTDAAFASDEVDVDKTRDELSAAQEAHRLAGADATAAAREHVKIDFAQAKLRLVGTV